MLFFFVPHRSSAGTLVRFPEHRHQRLRTAVTLPGVLEGGEIRRPHSEGDRAANGALQSVRRLAENHLLVYGLLEADPDSARVTREHGTYEGDPETG